MSTYADIPHTALHNTMQVSAERQRAGYDEPCDVVRPTIEELHTSIASLIERVVQARICISVHADALLGPRAENALAGLNMKNDSDSTIGLVRTLSAEIAALEHHIARF
jgi:hypothetical protein